MNTPLQRQLELIEAPSPLGLRPPSPGHIPGTRFMPRALVDAGLLDALPLAGHTTLPEPHYVPEPDGVSGIRNLHEVIRFTGALDRAITASLKAGRFPVVVGGDCSVLLGPAVSLRRLGHFALVHFDGHNDFGHEGNWGKPYPNVAGSDLAIVTGRGPNVLTDIDGLKPYFLDEDVFQLGEKADAKSATYVFKDFPLTAIHRMPLSYVKARGIDAAANHIGRMLAAAPVKGFWLHVDVDVIDSTLLPAVDSPENCGLGWAEFDAALGAFLRDPKLVGLNIGIFDPELDLGGDLARQIATVLRRRLIEMTALPRDR
jgi:arginase